MGHLLAPHGIRDQSRFSNPNSWLRQSTSPTVRYWLGTCNSMKDQLRTARTSDALKQLPLPIDLRRGARTTTAVAVFGLLHRPKSTSHRSRSAEIQPPEHLLQYQIDKDPSGQPTFYTLRHFDADYDAGPRLVKLWPRRTGSVRTCPGRNRPGSAAARGGTNQNHLTHASFSAV